MVAALPGPSSHDATTLSAPRTLWHDASVTWITLIIE